jgi:hypothetical protein
MTLLILLAAAAPTQVIATTLAVNRRRFGHNIPSYSLSASVPCIITRRGGGDVYYTYRLKCAVYWIERL